MKPFLIIFFFCLMQIAISQNPDIKRTWHWYFGMGAGLDFSSGSPVVDTSGMLHAKEGCAIISDTLGNLLFYTDGDTVWDRRHIPMPNGTGLASYLCSIENSSIQGCVIVPNPANNQQYYIITSDCIENNGHDGYRYSIVDMSLNSGFGDVIPDKKRILLDSPSTEGIAVTKITPYSWWILIHRLNDNKFLVYKLDSSGMNKVKEISTGFHIPTGYVGKFIFSKNKKFLLSTFDIVSPDFSNVYNELFLFDLKTADLKHFCNLWVYGSGIHAEFSYDDRYIFYTNSGNIIYYYSLCSDDTNSIQQSFKVLLYDSTYLGNNSLVGLQTGPDKKIYISADFEKKISYITLLGDSISYSILSLNLFRYARQQFPYVNHFYDNDIYCNKNDNLNPSPISISIPNIFTPNNDNVNDFFSIQISGYSSIEYFIYNRWGQLLHSGKKDLNPLTLSNEILWNGQLKNENAPTGTYYYLIKAYTQNQEPTIKKGFFQLLK
ncbi:MAG: gliding motility-associated C-terminal domain-containing protein [Bacteroidia bacterium]|nr:gliding motility-associated C-terminal domain-containing protein [Bacteroidia bacterium]